MESIKPWINSLKIKIEPNKLPSRYKILWPWFHATFYQFNTYSFRIVTQSGVAKFDFFEIFYTQGPFRWKG